MLWLCLDMSCHFMMGVVLFVLNFNVFRFFISFLRGLQYSDGLVALIHSRRCIWTVTGFLASAFFFWVSSGGFPWFWVSELREEIEDCKRYIFVFLACGTALTGIVEKTLFTIKSEYAKLPPEAYVINFYGISIVVFACLVVFIATKSEWKRPRENLPEHEALLSQE